MIKEQIVVFRLKTFLWKVEGLLDKVNIGILHQRGIREKWLRNFGAKVITLNQKMEAGGWKLEVGGWKPEVEKRKLTDDSIL